MSTITPKTALKSTETANTMKTRTTRNEAMKTAAENRESSPIMYETENDLPKDARVELIGILNQRLADSIYLQMQLKQAHWNVKGPHFIGLHELFDQIDEAVEGYVDFVAEGIVATGRHCCGNHH